MGVGDVNTIVQLMLDTLNLLTASFLHPQMPCGGIDRLLRRRNLHDARLHFGGFFGNLKVIEVLFYTGVRNVGPAFGMA